VAGGVRGVDSSNCVYSIQFSLRPWTGLKRAGQLQPAATFESFDLQFGPFKNRSLDDAARDVSRRICLKSNEQTFSGTLLVP
jgi:hypothetical protein